MQIDLAPSAAIFFMTKFTPPTGSATVYGANLAWHWSSYSVLKLKSIGQLSAEFFDT